MPAILTRPLPVAVLLGLVAQAMFSFRLGIPTKPMFDEIHYVPAARVLLELSRRANPEHPLLGKELIALGMMLFGDNSVGWRFFSTVAGTATIVSVYAIAWRLFRDVRTAAVAGVLALVNFTVLVQARIAMLDAFMAAFVLLAIVAMLWSARERTLLWWTLGSVSLGLAVAVKWAAVPYVAYAGLAFAVLKWRDPTRFPGLGYVEAAAILGVASVSTYFLTFAPTFFLADDPLTFAKILPFQKEMLDLQRQVLPPHLYQSDWWSWPFVIRPIWYLYENVDGAQRGVILVGNLAVCWGGLVAVAACLWALVRDRDERLGAAASLWIGSYGVWTVIPKSLGYFYYYYLPSIFLPLAIAAACHRYLRGRRSAWEETFLVVALGVFIYFWPMLTAAPLSGGTDAFKRWMWLPRWP